MLKYHLRPSSLLKRGKLRKHLRGPIWSFVRLLMMPSHRSRFPNDRDSSSARRITIWQHEDFLTTQVSSPIFNNITKNANATTEARPGNVLLLESTGCLHERGQRGTCKCHQSSARKGPIGASQTSGKAHEKDDGQIAVVSAASARRSKVPCMMTSRVPSKRCFARRRTTRHSMSLSAPGNRDTI